MRRRYIVCYDISDPKRLRRVFKTMEGYGEALQYSVFYCDLSPREKMQMIGRLAEQIHHKEDRVLIVDTGAIEQTRRRSPFEFLGRKDAITRDHEPVIV